MSKTCRTCGAELLENAKFCGRCGTQAGISVNLKTEAGEKADLARKKKKRKRLMAGVAAVTERLQTYLKAAKQGDMNAQYKCGVMYDGADGIAEDAAAALYWYRKAAEQGHVSSQYNCGLMYDSGEGTPEDKKEALYWFRRAAEHGDADAQFRCGMMYEKGEGTGQDWKEALNWYRKAAAQGHIEANYCMQEAEARGN